MNNNNMVEIEHHEPSLGVDHLEIPEELDEEEDENISLGLGNFPDDIIDEEVDEQSDGQNEELYMNESRRVKWMGWILAGYLVLAGLLCTTLTAWIMWKHERNNYEQAFHDAAVTLSTSLSRDLHHNMMQAMELLAADLQSHAREYNLKWPMVTMPSFAEKAHRFNQLMGTEQITLLPVVSASQKQAWEIYATMNQHWIKQSAKSSSSEADTIFVDQQQQEQQESISNTVFVPQYKDALVDENARDWFLPEWQSFPVTASTVRTVNTDWRRHVPAFTESLEYVVETAHPVLTPLYAQPTKWQATQWQTQLLVPIVVEQEGENDDETTKTVVAVLASAIAWEEKVFDQYFSTVFPRDMLEAAVLSSCTSSSSNGSSNNNTSILLTTEGAKTNPDLPHHDWQVSLFLSETLSSLSGNDNTKSVAAPPPPCQTVLEFYPMPSGSVKDDYYTTREPLGGALFCACIFGVALILWAAYSMLVAQRQALVLKRAVKSSAIVASLFPDNIRDRLLQNSQADGIQFSEHDIHIEHGLDNARGDRDHHHHNKKDKALTPSSSKSNTFTSNETSESSNDEEKNTNNGGTREPPKHLRLRTFLRDATSSTPPMTPASGINIDTKPIADFFPNCTVMFADIAGFTAWSSQREPHQVFTLLQNLYSVFDRSAKRMGVFKVETIGDSYVAVTGLPDPQKHHALIMAKFAMECNVRMRDVCKKLVKSLGPETEDLRMRFGMHSGPVTAGVLRGERSRFQLFGDTVNTAARMESCGEANRIQMSEATADLLIAAGKGNMVTPRDELIEAKGKGTMRVYWLEESSGLSRHSSLNRRMSMGSNMSSVISFGIFSSAENLMSSGSMYDVTGQSTTSFRVPPPGIPVRTGSVHSSGSRPNLVWGGSDEMLSITKFRRNTSSSTQRLIEWNTALLLRLLKQVVTKRTSVDAEYKLDFSGEFKDIALRDNQSSSDLVAEVAEIIQMPNFEPGATKGVEKEAMLSLEVENQLHNYVAAIASMYRDNPFHNYEHACHVEMSMSKLLERVVNPDNIDYEGESEQVASHAHNYTYGITSDPLTQFTVVFCALIHDVDHTGVSNGQLIKEQAHIASLYKNKSVAEQNSIDLAWDLLMQDTYKDLRHCIYTNETEFKRFRQLVVNTVLATDIFDKELSALRKNRWNKAFDEASTEESQIDAANRKATIVIEHLIQASDVSHTMQHWDIYRKWNERLFFEMNLAYKSGRTDSDPSAGWYKGELWFFDNYVIPLAKKLDSCGVFGVCSDECLVYAMENRQLWELHGEKIVEDLMKTDYYKKLKEEEDNKRRQRRGGQRKARGLDTKALDDDTA